VIPSEHFNAVAYAGTSATRSISSLAFQPDFIWIKARSGDSQDHLLVDSVRGTYTSSGSNTFYSEQYLPENWADNNYDSNYGAVSSLNSDGFSLGTDSGWAFVNESGRTYVAWNWKSGGTAVTNNDGNRPSSVSVNDAAGFSIVTYTGNDVNGETYGHGLTLTPELVIVKAREGSYLSQGWGVFGSVLSSTTSLRLHNDAATVSAAGVTNSVLPTATTFSVADNYNHNGSGHVAYCFHSVAGYSKVSSYIGNGSTDGTFVYTGFRPAYVMIKRTDGANIWIIHDTERDTHNYMNKEIFAESSGAEVSGGSSAYIDYLSNGFKLRGATPAMNTSGGTYIYLAFAESPFKHTNAR
jgi:hypothetical protein